MKKDLAPIDLAADLTKRSSCNVQVAAVIYDDHGVISWGWNSSGPHGYGQCAEVHAISRANRGRLSGASIAVVAIRRKTGRRITSWPCAKCAEALEAVGIYEIEAKR